MTDLALPSLRSLDARHPLSKVPEVTVFFWIVKVLTTGMGETASDFFAHRLGPLPAVAFSGVGLLLALGWQLLTRRYVAPVYWLAVVMVSVFGTLAADAVHVGLGVPYLASTLFFLVALAAIFWWWRHAEGTLSIHSIYTRRRELFYWAAVLTTFALGTAAGDMTAHTLNLGWLGSGLLFALLISLPALLRQFRPVPEIAAFWWAYILTRPLGASFADWLAVPHSASGLGFGPGRISLILTALIVLLVAYLALTRRDVEKVDGAA